MEVLRVSLVADCYREWKFRVRTFTGESKNKVYVLESETVKDKLGDYQEECNRRVKFDRLLQVTTDFKCHYASLNYYTWCLPEQLEEAKKLLMSAVATVIAEIRMDLDTMCSNFEKLEEL